jgi:hypothetical protein
MEVSEGMKIWVMTVIQVKEKYWYCLGIPTLELHPHAMTKMEVLGERKASVMTVVDVEENEWYYQCIQTPLELHPREMTKLRTKHLVMRGTDQVEDNE